MKSNYYKEKLDSSGNKSKMIWSVINEFLSKRKKRSKIGKVKKRDGSLTNSSLETANAFNEHYVNVGKTPHLKYLLSQIEYFLPVR